VLDWPFDQAFLRRLEQLKLRAGRSPVGPPRGEHRTYRKGSGLDFFDFRPYVPGDDPRYVDWNMFARLDRLIVKLFQAEENLCLHILIDTSKSMGIGNPSKLDYALRAAAALAYVGLANHERVALGLFDRTPYKVTAPIRGKSQFVPLLKNLTGARAQGSTDFKSALTAYASQSRMSGLAIIISDLFEAGTDYQLGIAALMKRRFEVRVLHVLAQEEVHPTLQGNLRLVDIENEETMEITADKQTLARYAANLERFRRGVQDFCSLHGVAYQSATTATPFDELLFRRLRERRFLQ
jgi:uncharacterized protein (DUF58 family)